MVMFLLSETDIVKRVIHCMR